jgi:hypothetical protein
MDLIKLWFNRLPKFSIPEEDGVVTAADKSFFPGLYLLCESCFGRVNMAVFDLGLSKSQRAWCASQPHVRLLSPVPLIVPTSIYNWQTWNKPFYLDRSPFRTTLWLDCDCIVVNDLTPLFEYAAKKPFVIRHNAGVKYSCRNPESLYNLMPTAARIPLDNPLSAGVLGFQRDAFATIMQKWQFIIREAAGSKEIRSHIQWYDEGSLHWALEYLDRIDIIVDRPTWNHLNGMSVSKSVCQFLLLLETEIRDNTVLHITGQPKFWSEWLDGLFCNDLLSFPVSVKTANIVRKDFDENYYLNLYQDVAKAVSRMEFKSGYDHYVLYGVRENRLFKKLDC